MNNFVIEETYIENLFVINSTLFEDNRGFFEEIYNKKNFLKLGISEKFVQDNLSFSKRGVLRGLHFQKINSQAKLIKVIKGKIFDVVVDLRKNSKSFGKYFSIILSEDNQKNLYIPKGFAHGFLTLEDDTIVMYKCSDFYNPKDEAGILWNDKTLNIDWKLNEFGIKEKDIILSEKDKRLGKF